MVTPDTSPELVTYLTDDPQGNVFVGHGDPLKDTSPAAHAFAHVITTRLQHRAILDHLSEHVGEHGPLTLVNGAEVLGNAAHAALRQTVEDPRQ